MDLLQRDPQVREAWNTSGANTIPLNISRRDHGEKKRIPVI
jgi:hypothetical protein